ncbi:MAG TPA: outer membrane beta-barrel protein [Myxococcales bacterium]
MNSHSIVAALAACATAGRAVAADEPAKLPEPFAFADFTWLNGNPRTHKPVVDTDVFTGELRWDSSYIADFAHPVDHTLGGSSESGRTDEFQLQQLGVGGDFHYRGAEGRIMTQFGLYSTMTPRNDASPAVGQWDLSNAYRYISEAYGGYHLDVLRGINVQAGIFMSYVGLFSYYNFDNWAYQPSYVSSNTPWFFNGVRVQIFASDKLKIEPWLVNGWQSYGKMNGRPGIGLQVLWRPAGWLSILSNSYAYGSDTLGQPNRNRWHSDDSIQIKHRDEPGSFYSKGAVSITIDLGCENGGGVVCAGGNAARPSQYFAGFMIYDRAWFSHDRFAITVGGGAITNPGRYLVLLPPVNGATAATGAGVFNADGSPAAKPYFTENPGDPFHAWDCTLTFDYMPIEYVTFRVEYNHRHASVAYFAGHGGMTPQGESSTANGSETNTGPAGSFVPGFVPDLRNDENRVNFALLVKL